MKIKLLTSLLLIGLTNAKAQNLIPENYTHYAQLSADSVIFQITLVNAYPFISAEVNGVKGKFMFDTGNQSAIELNDNYINLPLKKKIGGGNVASGQTFAINQNDTINEIKFSNGLAFKKLVNIKSENLDFLQNNITPDCLGYVGFNFFKGYLFKLDYLRRKLTFYKITPERRLRKDFLNGEKVLAVLNFETRRLPNHPLMKVNIGRVALLGAFDTGQYGLLQIDSADEERLRAQGQLSFDGKDSQGDSLLKLQKVILDGRFSTDLKGVEYATAQQVAGPKKGLGITERSVINFGYRFLDQYKTIWDYDAKKNICIGEIKCCHSSLYIQFQRTRNL